MEDGYTETVEQMTGKLYYDLKYISRLSIVQEIKILLSGKVENRATCINLMNAPINADVIAIMDIAIASFIVSFLLILP